MALHNISSTPFQTNKQKTISVVLYIVVTVRRRQTRQCVSPYLADAGGSAGDEHDLAGEVLGEEPGEEGVAGLEEVVGRVEEQQAGHHGRRPHPVEHAVHKIHGDVLFDPSRLRLRTRGRRKSGTTTTTTS